MKNLIAIIAVLIIVGAGCIRVPGSRDTSVRAEFPDQFKAVDANSLPKAIRQAFATSRNSVTVMSVTGQRVVLDISDPSKVTVTMTNVEGIDDLVARLDEGGLDMSGVVNQEVLDNGDVQFVFSEVIESELTPFVYEAFIQLYDLRSTQDWIIKLQ